MVGTWSPSLLLMPTLPAPTRPARRPRLVQPALHDSPPREPRCITGLGRGRENGRGLPEVPRVRDERGTRAGSFQLARVLRRSCLDMLAIKMRKSKIRLLFSQTRAVSSHSRQYGTEHGIRFKLKRP